MKKISVVILLALFVFSFFGCGSDGSDADQTDQDNEEEQNDDDNANAPVCGNKMIEEGEVCDGGALACGEVDSSYTAGIATCLEDCSGYDVSDCKGGEEDNGDEPQPEVLCWDTYLCVEGCYKEDEPEQCKADCLALASSDAKSLYDAMMGCVDANCSGAEDPGECAKENCAEEKDACFNHFEPAEPGTCMAIIECQQKCPQGDQGCTQSCVDQGNAQGQQLYNDYFNCYQECGGDQACVNEQCSEEQNACLNDK